VRRLDRLFRRHPVWVEAARRLDRRAESAVFFTHLPGRQWRLLRRRGETRLLSGRARDPDLVFRFTPAAVARLAAVRGDVADFAMEIFARMIDPCPARRIELRVVAPFARLAARGYVTALLAAGPRLGAFGIAHGVRTIGDLRGMVEHARGARRERRAPAGTRG
jgi:hypothetical protein